jgi:hypothetical protein
VEGSKNFGQTWFAMQDGYDSRLNSVFLSAYNSSSSGNNSTYSGKQADFVKHTIDIRTFDKFSRGDTLIIRFRLWSDPFAHGWGWALDDLSIKSVASRIDRLNYGRLKIWPNPGEGYVSSDPGEDHYGKNLKYTIINQTGVVVREFTLTGDRNNRFEISDLPPGIYLIVMQDGSKISTSRYTKLR